MTVIKIIERMFSPGLFVVIVLFASYLLVTFITPQTATSQEQFDINSRALMWIRISIALPYLIVWLATFYGMRLLKIAGRAGGKYSQFCKFFSLGLLFLLVSTIATTLMGAIQGYLITDSSRYVPMLTIVTNYSRALLLLIAYLYLLLGISSIKDEKKGMGDILFQSVLTVLILAVPYIALIFTNPNRQVPFSMDTAATYYIPDFFIISTIVLPILIGWIVGIVVALRLQNMFHEFDFSKTNALVRGLFLVIFSSMILQAISSLGSQRLFDLGLSVILLLVYLLLLFQAIGFVLMSRGVSMFSAIENSKCAK